MCSCSEHSVVWSLNIQKGQCDLTHSPMDFRSQGQETRVWVPASHSHTESPVTISPYSMHVCTMRKWGEIECIVPSNSLRLSWQTKHTHERLLYTIRTLEFSIEFGTWWDPFQVNCFLWKSHQLWEMSYLKSHQKTKAIKSRKAVNCDKGVFIDSCWCLYCYFSSACQTHFRLL